MSDYVDLNFYIPEIKPMKSIVIFSVLMSSCFFSFSQTETRILKVHDIRGYNDGYVIQAVDPTNADTLNIITDLKDPEKKHLYEKIVIGEKYKFEFDNPAKHLSGRPIKDLVLVIKTTVIWKIEDGLKNMPVYSTNMKGLYIKK
ncbi:hypothetical protein ACX0G9_05170 [Flavitalea flava]